MPELWHQCAAWLRECLQLDSTIRIESVQQLAAFLKDGIVLCAVANVLCNGCAGSVRRNFHTGTSQVFFLF